MARKWVVVLAAVICGCAEAPPRVLYYKAFDIIIGSAYQVDRLCGTTISDSGSYISVNQHIMGCYDAAAHPRIIVDRAHPEVLTHELSHWDGHADPEKDGYNW